ncbi:MAG: response regulator transcription factor [Verrucomicrobia bacterium]|nr:response regulator transcription factor [Verrucomicrobiota bacterium]
MAGEKENDESGKRRIFIVDDHPLVREGLANIINQQPDLETCGEAEDSAEALARVAESRPDLALVDISLKNDSGLDLVKKLKAEYQDLAVVVLSMHDETFYAERALRAGASGYVMKRESTTGLLDAIRRALQGSVFLSDTMVNVLAKRLHAGGDAMADPVQALSDRELEIFRLVGEGRGSAQIAEDLHISIKTVQAYCARAKDKLGIGSMVELTRMAIRWHDAQSQVRGGGETSV